MMTAIAFRDGNNQLKYATTAGGTGAEGDPYIWQHTDPDGVAKIDELIDRLPARTSRINRGATPTSETPNTWTQVMPPNINRGLWRIHNPASNTVNIEVGLKVSYQVRLYLIRTFTLNFLCYQGQAVNIQVRC